MARGKKPAPVLIGHTSYWEYQTDVLASPATFVVCYKGGSINVRTEGKRTRYIRTTFSDIHLARRLANRLNKLFETLDFTVHEATIGQAV